MALWGVVWFFVVLSKISVFDLLWSSFKEHTVDALALGAEEGRRNLR